MSSIGLIVGKLIITVLTGIAGLFLGIDVGRAVAFYKPSQLAGWFVSMLRSVNYIYAPSPAVYSGTRRLK